MHSEVHAAFPPRTACTQSNVRLQVPQEDGHRILNRRGAGWREARNAPAAAGIVRTRRGVRERIRTPVIEDLASRPARPDGRGREGSTVAGTDRTRGNTQERHAAQARPYSKTAPHVG